MLLGHADHSHTAIRLLWSRLERRGDANDKRINELPHFVYALCLIEERAIERTYLAHRVSCATGRSLRHEPNKKQAASAVRERRNIFRVLECLPVVVKPVRLTFELQVFVLGSADELIEVASVKEREDFIGRQSQMPLFLGDPRRSVRRSPHTRPQQSTGRG
jgi:hypothetical protein